MTSLPRMMKQVWFGFLKVTNFSDSLNDKMYSIENSVGTAPRTLAACWRLSPKFV